MNTLQLPFNGDAQNFLKLIAFTLDHNGGIVNINSNTLSIMESCKLMVDRCMIIHAMRATKEEDLKLLLSGGAWDELFFWLRDARSGMNVCMLMELLQLYKMLPVNTHLLRQNSCAKEIKQLIKFPDDRVSRLAKVVVSDWMEKVAGVTLQKLGSKVANYKSSTSQLAIDEESSSDVPPTEPQTNNISSSINDSEFVKSSRLTNDTTTLSKRPRTVKSLGNRMRSTGLEEPLSTNQSSLTKKPASTEKTDTALQNGHVHKQTVRTATKTKTIPANSLFSDFTSHGFLNALASTEPSNLLKRKRKPSQISPISNSIGPNFPKEVIEIKVNLITESVSSNVSQNNTTTTSTMEVSSEPIQPTDESITNPNIDSTLPLTLSFYRELENEEKKEEPISTSSPPTAVDEEISNIPENENNLDLGLDITKTLTLPSAEPAKKKIKTKKNISWADDFNLCTYYYFQVNKDERVNVSKYGGIEEGRKHEQEMERKLFQRHPPSVHTLPSTILKMAWRNPPPLDGLEELVLPGCNSQEKIVQMEREARVLQVIYFQREYIPDSPSEPDMEIMLVNVEIECKNIPLYDVTDPSSCPPSIDPDPSSYLPVCLPTPLANLFPGVPVLQGSPILQNGPVLQSGPNIGGPMMALNSQENYHNFNNNNMQNANGYMFGQPQMYSNQYGPTPPIQPGAFNPPPHFPPQMNSWPAPSQQLRPQFQDRPTCRHFINTGRCKFGNTCRFYHPVS